MPEILQALSLIPRCSAPQSLDSLNRLGSGTFGDVYEMPAKNSMGQDITVAAKRIKTVSNNSVHLRRAIRELQFMRLFKGHPNIVELMNVDYILNDPGAGLYLYFELMETDLGTIIKDGPEVLTEQHIIYIGYQLLCALNYIHSAQVVHRDLKPNNILVNRNGAVKICDLGLARSLYKDVHYHDCYTSYVTTRWYRAPEILLTVESYHYGLDIWSVACIIAEAALRKPLFTGRSAHEQMLSIIAVCGAPPYIWRASAEMRDMISQVCPTNLVAERLLNSKNVLKERIPQGYPPELSDLLSQMLQYQPQFRPTASASLSHPLFKTYRGLGYESDCKEIPNHDFEAMSYEELKVYLENHVKSTQECLNSENLRSQLFSNLANLAASHGK